jgi:hypothetical protein
MEAVKRTISGAHMLVLPAARPVGSNTSAEKEKETHDGAKKPEVSSEADICEGGVLVANGQISEIWSPAA